MSEVGQIGHELALWGQRKRLKMIDEAKNLLLIMTYSNTLFTFRGILFFLSMENMPRGQLITETRRCMMFNCWTNCYPLVI
jgi:hypothetical protein